MCIPMRDKRVRPSAALVTLGLERIFDLQALVVLFCCKSGMVHTACGQGRAVCQCLARRLLDAGRCGHRVRDAFRLSACGRMGDRGGRRPDGPQVHSRTYSQDHSEPDAAACCCTCDLKGLEASGPCVVLDLGALVRDIDPDVVRTAGVRHADHLPATRCSSWLCGRKLGGTDAGREPPVHFTRQRPRACSS